MRDQVQQTATTRERLGPLLAGVMVWLCGVAPVATMLMPLLIPQLQGVFKLDGPATGALAAADLGGACAATVTAPLWLRWSGVRLGVLAGLGLCVLGNAATLIATSGTLLIAARLLAGGGAGVVLSSVMPLLSRATNPARLVSAIQLLQLLLGAVLLALGAPVLHSAGMGGLLGIVIALAGGSMAVAALLPAQGDQQVARAVKSPIAICAARVLAGILVYFVANGMIGQFAGKLGVQQQLPLTQVGTILAASSLGAIPGSMLAIWVGGSVRRDRWIWSATALQVLATAAMLLKPGLISFGAGMSATAFCAAVIAPLQVTTLVDRDRSGRAIEALAAVQMSGQAIGPLIGGFFITGSRVDGAYVFGASACVLSVALVSWGCKALMPSAPRP